MPTASELIVRLAIPLPTVPVPSVVAPSRNVTVPVAPDVTVAVKVTLAPKVDEGSDEARATVLVATLTVWVSAVELAGL